MVVVFGWGSGPTRDRGEVVEIRCPTCHDDVYLHSIQSSQEFRPLLHPARAVWLEGGPGLPDLPARPAGRAATCRRHPGDDRVDGAMAAGAIAAKDYRSRVDWF